MELLARYSNHGEALNRLQNVLHRIASDDQTEEPGLASDPPPPDTPIRVSERLSEADNANLIDAFQSGTSKAKLAVRYGISESSVKRLLRAHGVRGRNRNPRRH